MFNKGENIKIPFEIQKRALLKLDILDSVTSLQDLNSLRGNRLEKLSGNYQGYYSIRINDKYRIVFRFNENKKEALEVEIIDYH